MHKNSRGYQWGSFVLWIITFSFFKIFLETVCWSLEICRAREENNDNYWVREDGAKMLGDYVIVAADLNKYPRGSIVDTSLGQGIVCDTGSFTQNSDTQLDIATDW